MPLKTRRPAKAAPEKRDIASRWTAGLVQGGWTPISDFFLEHYSDLDPALTTVEAMLVIQLMRHKWDSGLPYPAFKTLSKRMGLSDTAVRGHARRLEKKGYLRRVPRQGYPSQFDLQPLFEALERLQAGARPADQSDSSAVSVASEQA